ncbi:MAG: fatty acid desaturase [Rariglobus sp.]|nr:fatty acid desaturase [Rariglobus sp.]
METETLLQKEIKITWYRSPVGKEVMSRLMKKSDAKGLVHAGLHLALFAATATLAYLAYLNVTAANWIWSVPLLVLAVFVHGTFTHFMGGVAVHELCHKTPFRTQALNDFFLYLFSFLSWFDPVGYRLSHVKHHQATVHHDLDGEVILPQKLDWSALEEGEVTLPPVRDWKFVGFVLWQFLPFPNPVGLWNRVKCWVVYAIGDLRGVGMWAGGEWWTNQIFPEEKPELRRRHRNWARVLLAVHLVLATVFILTGHWFLILLITCASTYAGWLATLCALPQHLGMGPDVPDFRLCCRTYTCNRFIGFLYWNMQYHVEHHMFPAVPFYNLPALRKAISSDLPPAPHGLLATWREIIPILKKQREAPGYFFVPAIPKNA